MPSSSTTKTLLRELFTLERSQRVPEPDLVMDDPDKVAAFTRAGREDGIVAPTYLFNCAQVSELLRPGDVVVDLGCGPATQLAMFARLHPKSQFVGVDLSPDMLLKARIHVDELMLTNVEFVTGDITDLSMFADSSVDVVTSTLTLHHLPDRSALENTFAEISRVLKPEGSIYLIDFGRLKSPKSMRDFAYRHADRQPELFTMDYLYSLQAAFTVKDFQHVVEKYLSGKARVRSTFLMPFMVAVKSGSPDNNIPSQAKTALREIEKSLSPQQQIDLADLIKLFRLNGLHSPLLPPSST